MTRIDLDLRDKIAAEAAHAEASRDVALPYRRKRLAQASEPQSVYGIRLPIERIEQLRHLAAERGVEPSVLARSWVTDALDIAYQKRMPELAQWERDWRETAEHLRELLDHRPAGYA